MAESRHSTFRVIKGKYLVTQLLNTPGIMGVYLNPFGAGPDILEIIHTRTQTDEELIQKVKDVSISEVILEPINLNLRKGRW